MPTENKKAKIVSFKECNEDGKYYGRLSYHEWFVKAETLDELFDWVLNKYKTEKWWDYDGFSVWRNKISHTNNALAGTPFDWKSELTENQKKELKEAEDFNFKM